ncbi:MAG: lysylphosphatidylglycerol synthase transmembrane domain-containing protein [Nitrospinota bacterium]
MHEECLGDGYFNVNSRSGYKTVLKAKVVKNIGKVLISAVIFFLLIRYIDVEEAKKIVSRASPLYLSLVLLVFLLDRAFMSWKWTILLKGMGEEVTQFFAFKVYYLSSFLGMIIPFGVGPDIIRFFKVKKAGVKSDAAITSIIMERVLGLFATLGIVVIGLIIFLMIVNTRKEKDELLVLLIPFFVAIVLGGGFLLNDKIWHNTMGLSVVENLFLRLGGRQYYESFLSFREEKQIIIWFTLLSFIEQFFAIFAVYLGAKALSIPIGFVNCVAFVPLTILAERLPLTFMGIGLREGSYIFLLGFLDIDYTSAMLFSMLIFILEIFFLLPAGVWVLFDDRNPIKVSPEDEME